MPNVKGKKFPYTKKGIADAQAAARDSGGKLSDKDKEVAVEALNPGKSVDVTEMMKGGYMDDKVAEKMMGGYMKYEDKGK